MHSGWHQCLLQLASDAPHCTVVEVLEQRLAQMNVSKVDPFMCAQSDKLEISQLVSIMGAALAVLGNEQARDDINQAVLVVAALAFVLYTCAVQVHAWPVVAQLLLPDGAIHGALMGSPPSGWSGIRVLLRILNEQAILVRAHVSHCSRSVIGADAASCSH